MKINEEQSQQAVYIASLIFRAQENEPLTEQETEDLRKWLESGNEANDLMETLGNREEIARRVQELSRYDSDGVSREIFQKLDLDQPADTGRVAPQRRWLYAAAACMLLIGATWAYLTRKKPDSPIVVHVSESYPQEIPPGSPNKAILTLSDGSKIALDSVHNGMFARQGTASVTKSKGQLVYHLDTKTNSVASVAYNTVTTPKGGQYRIVLPDGSKVWINAASSLTYPTSFLGQTRTVTMTGEAYFEIAPKKDQPFIVKAGGVDVRVMGTHFNVMDYPDEDHLCATLLEGKVQVSAGKEGSTLIPGQEAVVSGNNVPIKVREADVERAVAWTTGFFEFEEADIKTIMREISRWYDVEVVFSNVDNTGRYGGRISMNQNLSDVLAFLEGNGIHHYRLEGRKLTVLP